MSHKPHSKRGRINTLQNQRVGSTLSAKACITQLSEQRRQKAISIVIQSIIEAFAQRSLYNTRLGKKTNRVLFGLGIIMFKVRRSLVTSTLKESLKKKR